MSVFGAARGSKEWSIQGGDPEFIPQKIKTKM